MKTCRNSGKITFRSTLITFEVKRVLSHSPLEERVHASACLSRRLGFRADLMLAECKEHEEPAEVLRALLLSFKILRRLTLTIENRSLVNGFLIKKTHGQTSILPDIGYGPDFEHLPCSLDDGAHWISGGAHIERGFPGEPV